MALLDSPYNYLLHYALLFAAIPWFYSYYNDQHRLATMGVEKAITKAWDRVISFPTINFQKIVVGINCNVDLIMSGVNIMNKINASVPERIEDHEQLNSLDDLYSTFLHFFSKGAPVERFMANEEVFEILTKLAESKDEKVHHYIGGNAALMAQKIASSFPTATAYLVGPIGPRSHALLHPSVVRNNSTRIAQDELHMIYEYKQGEIIGEFVAPSSSRFITSHDQFSGSSIVIEMFFKAIADIKPDLIILSGIHLLQFQPKEIRLEKLRLIKRSLLQVNPLIPIHLEMASMSEPTFANDILYRIIPYTDSIALNEQELTFLSKVGNGPYNEQYPVKSGALHVHKVVEMLYWLLSTFGHDRTNPESPAYNYRLQRIHFHCLTYHIVVSKGRDWSNLAAGLAAGAKLAGRQACNIRGKDESDLLEIRTPSRTLLDKHQDKVYQFDPHDPLASWMRNELVFIYTPVLVCKFPVYTVGVDDAISATALLYSQFYKMEKFH
uniref:ADP-dependent glucokinase n=1 Tax=Panagrolaimus sp. JU765 TaxID=591449 RepID=A0AC34QQ58_9BILA